MIKHIKHHYQVVLTIENRDDVDDDFKKTEQVLFETHNRDKAMDYIYTHRHLESYLEPNDNGDHWLTIKTLRLKQL